MGTSNEPSHFKKAVFVCTSNDLLYCKFLPSEVSVFSYVVSGQFTITHGVVNKLIDYTEH